MYFSISRAAVFLIARLVWAAISAHAEMVFFQSNGLAEITPLGWKIEAMFP